MQTIYTITGPSGVGKTTLVKALVRRFCSWPYMTMKEIVSATTRTPREGEVDGEDYRFITRETAIKQQAADRFVEHVEYHGNLYGIRTFDIEEALEEADMAIVIVERNGLRQLKEFYERDAEVDLFSVLVLPPNMDALRNRMKRRDQDEETFLKRMQTARQEVAENWGEFDFILVNDDFDVALRNMSSIIELREQLVKGGCADA